MHAAVTCKHPEQSRLGGSSVLLLLSFLSKEWKIQGGVALKPLLLHGFHPPTPNLEVFCN